MTLLTRQYSTAGVHVLLAELLQVPVGPVEPLTGEQVLCPHTTEHPQLTIDQLHGVVPSILVNKYINQLKDILIVFE